LKHFAEKKFSIKKRHLKIYQEKILNLEFFRMADGIFGCQKSKTEKLEDRKNK